MYGINEMIIKTIIPFSFALLLGKCNAFFFTKNTSDYNNLSNQQVAAQEVSSTSLPVNTSIDNSTLSNNETEVLSTQQHQEQNPTSVDPSAAFYEKAFVIAPRISGPISIVGSMLVATEVI